MSDRRLTGNHIVLIVIAMCAAVVLTPVGVYAVATQKVSIADFDRPGRTARIDTAGRVHAAAMVSGAVSAAPSPPEKPFHREGEKDAFAVPVGAPVPQGKSIAVTSVSITIVTGAGGNRLEWREATDAGECQAGTAVLSTVALVRLNGADIGPHHFVQTFPVPQVQAARGRALCLWILGSPSSFVIVDGYLF